jgi:hypothetical protein
MAVRMLDMAGGSERRAVHLWLSAAQWVAFDGLAERLGVETGALVREAAVQGMGAASREVSAGRVRLRRRSGVPVGPDVVVERPSVVRGAPAAVPALSRAEAFRLAAGRRSGS